MIRGRYSDGVRPVSIEISVEPARDGLALLLPDGRSLIWPYEDTHFIDEDGRIELHRIHRGLDSGERLSLESIAFRTHFEPHLGRFRKGRAGEIRTARIGLWIAGAVASLALVIVVLIPLAARLLAPLVPLSWEKRLGEAVEPQVHEMFSKDGKPRFCSNEAGNIALDKMVQTLIAGTPTPFRLRVAVVDNPLTNAFALPGGTIFLFRPIIARAQNPDEVAGVLAHEIGHVINRDAMRHIIHTGANSAIIGMIFGDVLGFSAFGTLGTMLFNASYSREIEHEADQASVRLMGKAGADPRAINLFFGRMLKDEGKEVGGLLSSFSSHPVTNERIKRVDALAENAPPPRAPILTRDEWNALKGICKD